MKLMKGNPKSSLEWTALNAFDMENQKLFWSFTRYAWDLME
jgi:hypothetical protein